MAGNNKKAMTTNTERLLLNKTFATVMAKKNGVELVIATDIKPLNKHKTQFAVFCDGNNIHQGETLSKAAMKYEQALIEKEK